MSPFQLQDEYEYYEPESAKGSILELKARQSSVNQALQFYRNFCFFLLEKKKEIASLVDDRCFISFVYLRFGDFEPLFRCARTRGKKAMSTNRVQASREAASPSPPPPSLFATAEADADAQQVVQLVNRFLLSSVQFLNRFAEECESKLVRTDGALQQLELQTQLLEHLLLSSGAAAGEEDEEAREDDDGERDAASASQRSSDDSSDAAPSYDEHRRHRRRHRSRDSDSGASDTARRLPQPPNNSGDRNGDGSSRSSPPAAPGAYRRGPPRPPSGVARAAAAAQEAIAARVATLAIVGAPVLLPPPSASGEPPAPPPPLELRPGRLSMRNHPKLKGYFELLALRVPAAFVKAKMQADGYQGDWLDTPDAPAPATLSTVVRAFADEPD